VRLTAAGVDYAIVGLLGAGSHIMLIYAIHLQVTLAQAAAAFLLDAPIVLVLGSLMQRKESK
jgi:hypothetical protein